MQNNDVFGMNNGVANIQLLLLCRNEGIPYLLYCYLYIEANRDDTVSHYKKDNHSHQYR